jgi:hypothetical protein
LSGIVTGAATTRALERAHKYNRMRVAMLESRLAELKRLKEERDEQINRATIFTRVA